MGNFSQFLDPRQKGGKSSTCIRGIGGFPLYRFVGKTPLTFNMDMGYPSQDVYRVSGNLGTPTI